jgi:hypothetical protein
MRGSKISVCFGELLLPTAALVELVPLVLLD